MIRRFLSQPTMKLFGQAKADHPTPRALHQGKTSDSRSKHQANDQSGNGGNGDGHGNTPPIIRPYLQSRSYHGHMPLYWLCYRHHNGDFTEGHELPGKWKVAKQMVGRRLSQEEAKRLLAKLA